MKHTCLWVVLLLPVLSCKERPQEQPAPDETPFTIALGSCNRAELTNPLWDDILAAEPNLWIWGGDNIYADTDSIPLLRAAYARQDSVPGYARLREQVPMLGTWDDHDYGLNDGGAEFHAREGAQQAFLDFFRVPANHPRRLQEGIYHSETFRRNGHAIKVILLDTRYHRSSLTPDTTGVKRYVPNPEGEGTMLGAAQWAWLERELRGSRADFNIVVSSIQVLSDRHGYEAWGNMPHERTRLLQLLATSGAKGVILISGDRHISEFARWEADSLAYPIVEVTSSGLTHVYSSFSGEENPYRVGEVVAERSFALLKLYPGSGRVRITLEGDSSKVLGALTADYR